jgi:uncharacterized protein
MPPAPTAVCAHCHRQPVTPEWRPFCSQRCKLLDLARWLDGDFRIAGEAVTPDPSDPDAPPSTES